MNESINKKNCIESTIDYMLEFYQITLPFYEINKEMLEFTLMLEEYFNILFNPNSIIGLDKKDIIHLVTMLHVTNKI